MPKVEIDEEEFRKHAGLRETVAKMLANPAAKKLMQQAHKLVDPAAVTPELDATSTIDAKLVEVDTKIAAWRKEQEDGKAKEESERKLGALNDRVEREFGDLRKQGVTDDGIKGVKEIMEKEGILSPSIAWSHFEKLHPPQHPVTPGGTGGWNFMEARDSGDDDIKKLIETKGESSTLLDKMAATALNEVRGGARR